MTKSAKMMKALQIVDVGKAELVDVPVPRPGKGEALVKVTAVATCPQWDLHVYFGEPMFVHLPNQYPHPLGRPGHEMMGEVVEVGEGVSLRPGQRVAAGLGTGTAGPGCYAEYVTAREMALLAIPDDLSSEQVVSLELAMCVASSVLRLKMVTGIAGKRCAVVGLGPAGLIAVQMFRAEGTADILAIDPKESRRELAMELGATRTLLPGSPDRPPRRRPGAVDITLDCVGSAEAVHDAMDDTNLAVALFGVQREPFILRPRHRGLDIINYPGAYRGAAEYALQLIIDGKLDMTPLISCKLPFSRYAQAVQLLHEKKAIKVCLVPDANEQAYKYERGTQ